ncbi:hypothetical protein ACRRTK_023031 [Alexandromys fortis]
MPREDRATWKSNYFLKIIQLLDDYPKRFTVGVDNVGSKQVQQTRMSLRGKVVMLMGKGHHDAEGHRGHLENHPALERLCTLAPRGCTECCRCSSADWLSGCCSSVTLWHPWV